MDYNSYLKRDYKSLCQDSSPRLRMRFTRLHVTVLLAGGALLGTLLAFASHEVEAKRTPDLQANLTPGLDAAARITLPLELAVTSPARPAGLAAKRLSGQPQPGPVSHSAPDTTSGTTASVTAGAETAPEAIIDSAASSAPDNTHWTAVTVRRGDTLAAIFARAKLSPRDLHRIMALGKPTAGLTMLLPGQRFRLRTGPDGTLQELVYHINKVQSLHVQRSATGFKAVAMQRTPEVRLAHASATINSSLFLAGQKSGLPENLIMELAGIFAWDIDFALDI